MGQNNSPASNCSARNLSTQNPDSIQESYRHLLQDVHSKIPYNMTNDYMFRAVLQSNSKVLKGLLCSLLHLAESEIHSVEITNPIILGEAIEDKEFRLDININLKLNPHRRLPGNRQFLQSPANSVQQPIKPLHQHINLEMQVANQLNWQNRSLLYLCRSFDSLNHGQNYWEVEPAIQIGFLDYTLFKDQPEFYATYKLINMKNHNIYSDNFVLNVVDLTHIDLATREDKKYHIDSWAALFKATTWGEIIMLASINKYFDEAVNTILNLNAVEQVRKRCRDREEYYQDIQNYQRAVADREAENAELIAENAEMAACITKKDISLAKKDALITAKDISLAKKDAAIAKKDATIAEKDSLIQKLIAENEKLKMQMEQ